MLRENAILHKTAELLLVEIQKRSSLRHRENEQIGQRWGRSGSHIPTVLLRSASAVFGTGRSLASAVVCAGERHWSASLTSPANRSGRVTTACGRRRIGGTLVVGVPADAVASGFEHHVFDEHVPGSLGERTLSRVVHGRWLSSIESAVPACGRALGG